VDRCRDWEDLRSRHVEKQEPGPLERKLYAYKVWRKYFVTAIVAYKQNRPALYQDVLRALNLSSSEEHMLPAMLDARFSLGAYLALSVEAGVVDSINVHDKSWGALIVLFGLFALLHALFKIALVELIPVSIAIVVLMLLGMWHVVRKRTREINSIKLDDSDRLSGESSASLQEENITTGVSHIFADNLTKMHEGSNTELGVMRLFQVVLYVICFTTSTTVISVPGWQNHWITTLLQTLGLLLLFALLLYMLPHYVPLFLAQMALPPYVDEQNQEVLLQVLSEHQDHQQLRKSTIPASQAWALSQAAPPASAPPMLVGQTQQMQGGRLSPLHNSSSVEKQLGELLQAEEDLAKKVAERAALLRAALERITHEAESGGIIPGMPEMTEEV